MWIRILTAVVALAVFVPILLFAPNGVILCVFGALAAVALYEIAGCVGLRKNYVVTFGSMLVGFVWVVSQIAWLKVDGIDGWAEYGEKTLLLTQIGQFALVAFILLFVGAAVIGRESMPVEKLGLQAAFGIYVLFAFRSLGMLLSVQDGKHLLLWVVLCIPWVADSLAYFTGRACGKHKLCPVISPKKTVEGAIGGVAGTGVLAVILYACFFGAKPLTLLAVFGVTVALAVVSIFGDLLASVVKRRFDVKDYGKLFPGHGGVLDRFDSILPVAILASALAGLPCVMELIP